MARLLPKSSSPLRGSSFKFSAPQTGPSAVASVSLPTPGAATFSARPNRPPPTSSMAAPTSDADESELSDLPSSPSPAPLSKSVTATGAKPETAAVTPSKSSNRSSLSSHLPLTTSPSSTGEATRHAPSSAATVAVAAPEIAHAIPAVVAATMTGAHDPDQVLGSREGSPGRKRDVELVMVSDSESDMSMVSTTAGGDESHAHMDPPPRVMMATRSPLHPPPEPCIKNENMTPVTLQAPSNPGRTPASPTVRKYVRPATAPVLAAAALPAPARTTNKRARSMVDDDETSNLGEDDGEDGDMPQATPGGLVATEGLRRSMRVRTPVKRLGTF
ncbi:hypothetical protein BCR44DRAFT_1426419 [Catenaria anguillulae PL171]|uniref:Uncharacterized protein n=1 Tax=Catenaria anguillulae PL171 TaxID=765915 RepID=A0A1Y2HXM2_9FUNG|nr:hypothetical protein BCR44DRAFT_1426419 [Catenaria anguillulae PL171]